MKSHSDPDSVMLLQILSVMIKLDLIDRTIYDPCRMALIIDRGPTRGL